MVAAASGYDFAPQERLADQALRCKTLAANGARWFGLRKVPAETRTRLTSEGIVFDEEGYELCP